MRLRFVTACLLMLVFFHLAPAAEIEDSLLYKFTGEALGDMFGMSVSGAGDVNADSCDDLIIGAPMNDSGGTDAGRAYVYSGMDTSLLYVFTGATDNDILGLAVSGAGDVNNDGYDDLIIGAPQSHGTSHWGAGIAYVRSGADSSLMYTFTGEAEFDRFGWGVSGAGDVNNDSFADVIVGGYNNDVGGNNTGRAYVFYGGEGPFPITVPASDADMIFTGTVVGGGLGFSVSDAGDINNDTCDDLFVGAWAPSGTATAYVYSGLDGSVLYSFIAESQGDHFGSSVSDAGDLNNDTIEDFIVGAFRNNTAGYYAGRAYAFYGRSESFPITINAADADLIFTGENEWDYFGCCVSSAGDINNDGYDDIVVGANGYDNWIGRVYIYSGVDGALLHVLDGEGETEYDQFGGVVSIAGDINNDGLPDLIIGARDDHDSGPGKAYVYSFTVQKDSLLTPSVSVQPCNECELGYGVQPVMTNLTQPIKGASIPIEVPDNVEICSVSTAGCITHAWDFNIIDDKSEDSGFVLVALANTQGYTIPIGTTTVFNIFFTAPRECTTNYYIPWDTALSWDPMRSLLFSDTNNQALTAYFDPNRDSTEIHGYLPGDVDDNGGVNVADLTYLVDYMFFGGPAPCVLNAADVNGDCGINIADLTYLVDYLFLSGPVPVCGCIGGGAAALKISTDISVLAKFEDGITTIALNSPVALRGLQLELKGAGVTTPVSLLDNQIDLLYGEQDNGIRVGLLDLQGEAIIESGTQGVIELSGEFEITEAIVSDMNHRGLAVSIGAAKETSLPTEFALHQNFPNPFNPTTEISFSLPVAADVKLEVYNVMGQQVATIVDRFMEAGRHSVTFDGRAVASGIYFYRLEAGEVVETRKMVLLK